MTKPPRRPVQGTFPALSYRDLRLTDEVVKTLHEALRYPQPRATPTVRLDQADLSPEQQDRFLDAYRTLVDTRDPADSRYNLLDRTVNIHADMRWRMHTTTVFFAPFSGERLEEEVHHFLHHPNPAPGMQRFLGWHRAYVYAFERELRRADPDVVIPYWDWIKDPAIPPWMDYLPKGMRDINGTAYDVTRNWNPTSMPSEGEVRDIMDAQHSYTGFTLTLEIGPHGAVHVAVGGSMGSVPRAPADPLFWLHHANIDRLWAIWQKHNPGEHPLFAPGDEVMTPWTVRYDDLAHTSYLGYRYAREELSPPVQDHPLVTAEAALLRGVDKVREAKGAAAAKVEETLRRRAKVRRR